MGSYRSNIVAQLLFTYKASKCCANMLACWDSKSPRFNHLLCFSLPSIIGADFLKTITFGSTESKDHVGAL